MDVNEHKMSNWPTCNVRQYCCPKQNECQFLCCHSLWWLEAVRKIHYMVIEMVSSEIPWWESDVFINGCWIFDYAIVVDCIVWMVWNVESTNLNFCVTESTVRNTSISKSVSKEQHWHEPWAALPEGHGGTNPNCWGTQYTLVTVSLSQNLHDHFIKCFGIGDLQKTYMYSI